MGSNLKSPPSPLRGTGQGRGFHRKALPPLRGRGSRGFNRKNPPRWGGVRGGGHAVAPGALRRYVSINTGDQCQAAYLIERSDRMVTAFRKAPHWETKEDFDAGGLRAQALSVPDRRVRMWPVGRYRHRRRRGLLAEEP